jgi:hypothetical protein
VSANDGACALPAGNMTAKADDTGRVQRVRNLLGNSSTYYFYEDPSQTPTARKGWLYEAKVTRTSDGTVTGDTFYCYDATGNMTKKSSTASCGSPTWSYVGHDQQSGKTYDANGNAASVQQGSLFTYNNRNQTTQRVDGSTTYGFTHADTMQDERDCCTVG